MLAQKSTALLIKMPNMFGQEVGKLILETHAKPNKQEPGKCRRGEKGKKRALAQAHLICNLRVSTVTIVILDNNRPGWEA